MKAFLMYRDRDFDPTLLLARRERELHYSHADERALDLRQLLPWNEAALRQDLGLDVVINAMAGGDHFLAEVAKVALLSTLTDLATIQYRQQVLTDCLKNAPIVADIYRLAVEAVTEERKHYWGYWSRYPGAILHRAVDVLQMFVGMLRRLRSIADQHGEKFRSEGFSNLFSMLRRELSDEYFAEIEAHLRRLKFRNGVLISAELGKGNKGKNYVLRRPNDDNRSWFTRLFAEKAPSYTYQLAPRDEAGAHALAALNDRGVNVVANALAQSTDHILHFFQMLRTEVAFYRGCLNLHAALRRMGEPMCLPALARAGERKLSFRGLYDVSLALSLERKVVGNDLTAHHKDLVIITGPNTGGKSTFLRSIGLAHLMMQAGLFVPAEAFFSEASENVFTHYKREEDVTMVSGKWDEELGRMSEIIDRLKANSVLLCNESLASTNEREGSEIARQVVQALIEKRVKVFFVTHLYRFARGMFDQKLNNAVFLRAERRADGTRTFKVIEGEPLQTSYGEDLYRKVFESESLTAAD